MDWNRRKPQEEGRTMDMKTDGSVYRTQGRGTRIMELDIDGQEQVLQVR